MSINIETKTNGYKAEGLQEMIAVFNKVAEKLFPGCNVSHFYYGDHLDMADLFIRPGDYGHFDIRANSVRMNGLACMNEDLPKLESMTFNDELYDGKLKELAV